MSLRIATQKEKFQFLGAPGDTDNLVRIKVPFQLHLSWKLGYTIRSFQCHKLIAPNLTKVYQEISKLDPELLADSDFDIWGGCYEFRPVRGTEKKASPPFSDHAWGAAVDHDPARNGLRTRTERANWAKPEYKPIHDIFEKYGFINIGKFIGRDWMHWTVSYELISDPKRYL
jgi:hypothetical protein